MPAPADHSLHDKPLDVGLAFSGKAETERIWLAFGVVAARRVALLRAG